jgi:8-hydroxy-5-deazaflavin:NADPH oxidoreductase
MKVALVGGTGSFGRALAQRLRAVGETVAIGSRDPARARELAMVYGVEGGGNDEVVRDADLVILAVRSNAALSTARQLAEAIGTTPLLSVASDLRFTEDGVLPGRLGRSLAEEIADVVSAPVTAGLQSLAAVELSAREPPDQDALVCGDDARAKELTLEVAGKLVAGRALDAGPLANARALEGMTAVIIHVNRVYGAHAGIRLTGLH